MDKLRALTYCMAAADTGSLAGAARRLDVSVPAVHKLIASLESVLGVALFDRTARGLTLTADGQRYVDACRDAVDALAAADDLVRREPGALRGTITIGATPQLAQHVIAPALGAWRARYPDLQFDIRSLDRVTDPEAAGVDVFVLHGWPHHPELILRVLASTPMIVCASPAYWADFGVPRRPADLMRHQCLSLRNPAGIVVDLWEFSRGDERETVAVSGWLISNHRDILLDATLKGTGIGRFVPTSLGDHLRAGRLVPALLDWKMLASAPVNLLYRPNQRRSPRVRHAIDFLTALFAQDHANGDDVTFSRLAAERPSWYGSRYAHASLAARRR